MAAACLASGIFAPLCIIVALIVALVISSAVTAAAALAAGQIGAALGALADEIEGQGEKGESVQENSCITFSGAWITDEDHGWNEIHDIERVIVHGRGKDLEECLKVASAESTGLVRIG